MGPRLPYWEREAGMSCVFAKQKPHFSPSPPFEDVTVLHLLNPNLIGMEQRFGRLVPSIRSHILSGSSRHENFQTKLDKITGCQLLHRHFPMPNQANGASNAWVPGKQNAQVLCVGEPPVHEARFSGF